MANDPGSRPPDEPAKPRERFATTHWSLVLAAGGHSSDSAGALAELCTEYWYPLYAFVRRRGHDPEEAQDLTQAFFLKLLENDDIARADPQRGRFRTFLLAALKHFLVSEWRRATALKRGGDAEILALDFRSAEQLYRIEPQTSHDPEALYARRWALGLLESALEELQAEYERAGKAELFESLKGALGGEAGCLSYGQLADELGQSEGALRTATSRLRRRFRDRIRSRVAQTVARDEDVDDEIRHLFSALA